MSGEAMIRKPRPNLWRKALEDPSVEPSAGWNKEGLELRDFLAQMTATDIAAALPVFPLWTPFVDGGFIPEEYTLGKLADDENTFGKPSWVKEIMVGDVAHDVSRSIPNSLLEY
jgi:hypothetical protein